MNRKSAPSPNIPIAHEELNVGKRTLETGRVHVRTRVSEHTEWVREELAREDVDVEWVDVNREVETVPPIRTEGDSLIIPLFEEVLVVEKRLVLRKEIHITRHTKTQPFEAEVPLRRVEADVTRSHKPARSAHSEEKRTTMPRTLTAFYDRREDAEQARNQLVDAGIQKEDIDISAEGGQQAASSRGGGFMESVKHFFMPEEDRRAYAHGMAGGGAVLMVRVPEGQEERVVQILDQSGAVDFDERQRALAQQADQGRPQSDRQAPSVEDEVALPVAEERLRVGKREVDRGTVRVRSYVTEHPATEEVQLRDEHVDVERRPVGERMTGSPEGVFEERTFEVSESGEEPVVGKETVVTEEVRVTKEAEERTEKIEDTVRRTDVEVEDERRRRGEGEGRSDATQPRPPR